VRHRRLRVRHTVNHDHLPANGASHTLGLTVLAAFHCTEGPATWTIATCNRTAANGKPIDTSSTGTKSAYEAGRQPGEGPGNDGGKLWRYDNWMRDEWRPTVRRTGMNATPKEFRASWETHLIAAGAKTDDVAAIAGHSVNVQAEHYRQALHRSSDFIRAAIG
jgi:hypothetical protein